MKTITIYNNKGGVGKTTITAGLAMMLGIEGKKVLVIDSDPQGNITTLFNMETENTYGGQSLPGCIHNLIYEEESKVAECVKKTSVPNVDILTGGAGLTKATADIEEALTEINLVYAEIIADIENDLDYDYVLIDTQPELVTETTQILLGSDYLLIPITTSGLSLAGMDKILKRYKSCRKSNKKLQLLGILLNNVDKRTRVSKEIIPALREAYGDMIFDNVIIRSNTVEAFEHNENGMEYIACPYTKNLKMVVDEMVKRIG